MTGGESARPPAPPTADDVLRWISDRLEASGQVLEAGLEIDLTELRDSFPPGDARVAITDAIYRAQHDYQYLRFASGMGQVYALTLGGARRIETLRGGEQQGLPARRRSLLFLSHAAADKVLAARLKTWLEERVPGLDVFMSSDPSDLPVGAKWPVLIQERLAEAGALVILATERGLRRPWVWFEIGTAWFLKDIAKIPLCLGAVRKNALPAPLNDLQGVNADDAEDLDVAVRQVAQIAGLPVTPGGSDQVRQELVELDRALRATAEASGTDPETATSTPWISAQTLAADEAVRGENKVQAFTVVAAVPQMPFRKTSLAQLRDAVERATFGQSTGWPIGHIPGRSQIQPAGDGIVANYRDPAIGPSCRYWALSLRGEYVHAANLLEDETAGLPSGVVVGLDWRVEAIAQAWLYMHRLFTALAVPPAARIAVRFRHIGFAGRTLRRIEGPFGTKTAALKGNLSDVVASEALDQIDARLVDLVKACAAPVLEQFHFTVLDDPTYRAFVAKARDNALGRP